MKKIKIVLMTLAIIIAVSGAAASRVTDFCEYTQQYIKTGYNTYCPAGDIGTDYICIYLTSPCTYWQPDPVGQPDVYVPCRYGLYVRLIF